MDLELLKTIIWPIIVLIFPIIFIIVFRKPIINKLNKLEIMNVRNLVHSISKQVLNASFLFSHILIPLGVLSFYFESLSFFLPEGVNKAFVVRSAKWFLPVTIILFITYFSIIGLRKMKPQFFSSTGEKFYASDLILPLLPLTPVVQYIINNSDILSWLECIVIFCLFLSLASVLIFVVPLLYKNTDSIRPLMFLGMAFTFLITNMASLSRQFSWYGNGSLKIQLLILGGVWFISWLLFKINLRNFLYLLIAVNFASNSFLQIINREGTQSNADLNQTNNMLVRLIDSREPVVTPSIYLLVYDAYVANETMLAHGIDNRDQEQYLKDLGFKMYPHTYSVANDTIGSMSRVLNNSMSYYGNERRAVSGDGLIQNLLEKFGYKTYGVFGTDFVFRGIIPSYDYSFPGSSSSSVSFLLTKAIFLGEMRFDINFDEVSPEGYIEEKKIILSNVTEEPKFIYMHSKLPGHSQNSGDCRPNEIELFSERLALANVEMRQDTALVMENDPEAIVIVAGDHGPYLTKNCMITRDEYDISEITRLDIQDRNGTFLAIRWPSSDFEEYDDITVLQDLFPTIFAYIFEDQGLLESKIEPITVNGTRISGVEVSDGTIVGGIHDGEALFP